MNEALQLSSALRAANEAREQKALKKDRRRGASRRHFNPLPKTETVTSIVLSEDEERDGYELRFPPKGYAMEPDYEVIVNMLNKENWGFSKFKNGQYDPRWYIRRSPAAKNLAEGLIATVKIIAPTTPTPTPIAQVAQPKPVVLTAQAAFPL